MKSKQTEKLWGAAFSQKPSEAVIAFTAGRDVVAVSPADEKLLPYDLWVNKAHCIMLAKTGIIPKSDAGNILNQKVMGEVTVKLLNGAVDVVMMKSPFGFAHTSFTNSDGYKFNVNASAGFIEIYSLQMKLANQAGKSVR